MQLGKLGASQRVQELSCKTSNNAPQSDQWLTTAKQNCQALDPIIRRDLWAWPIDWFKDQAAPLEERWFIEKFANISAADQDRAAVRVPA